MLSILDNMMCLYHNRNDIIDHCENPRPRNSTSFSSCFITLIKKSHAKFSSIPEWYYCDLDRESEPAKSTTQALLKHEQHLARAFLASC